MIYKAIGFLRTTLDKRNTGKDGKWIVRDFVLTLDDGSRVPQHIKFQAIKGVVGQLDAIPTDSRIEVEFTLKGREYESTKTFKTEYFNINEAVAITLK